MAEGTLGVGKKEQDVDAMENACARRKLDVERVDEPEPRKRRRLEAAEASVTLAEELREQNREFFCAVCDKQYKTVQEFAQHLSSYDHHHRKRFAEMKEAQKDRPGAAEERDAPRLDDDKARDSRFLLRIYGTFPVRVGRETVQTTRTLRGYAEHSRSSSPRDSSTTHSQNSTEFSTEERATRPFLGFRRTLFRAN